MLINQQLLVFAICLALSVIGNDARTLTGLEIKQAKFCDPHDETAKIQIYPWPFIPSGKRCNISLTFIPAVDVFAATLEAELTWEPESDYPFVQRYRYYVCPRFPEMCSLPAGETHVWTLSDVMTSLPPGFKMTTRVVIQIYNEDHIMFAGTEIVATTH
ncbi:uncharacterized protein LOC110043838 [Orbicella faveolata]|uniref:uncharacterized protein LOC110043838 n=1 Tax=Orbicella faveolata TaxID=48498 RepID=UPI0009E5A534|nr:uncharacterized protein LOC110043838 [Orbicella faveolata]